MEKIDPYNHKQKYLAWKARSSTELLELSVYNRSLFFKYMFDMESGLTFFRARHVPRA